MPKPRSNRVRMQTGRDRNTARVRVGYIKRTKPKATERQVKPLTVRVLEYYPPLEQPVELDAERIWDSSRA